MTTVVELEAVLARVRGLIAIRSPALIDLTRAASRSVGILKFPDTLAKEARCLIVSTAKTRADKPARWRFYGLCQSGHQIALKSMRGEE